MRLFAAVALGAILWGGCADRGDDRSWPVYPDELQPPFTQVTGGRSGADHDPEISRDGRLLFYASTAYGEASELFVKQVGSNTATRVSSRRGDKRFPRQNPTHPRMIAFCSNERGSWELCLIEDYQDPLSQTIVLSEPGTDNLHPSWSPDGRQIVYCSSPDAASGDWHLKVRDLSSGQTRVLEDLDGMLPDWSPTGNRIVFQRMKRRDDWQSTLWTLELENGSARNVTAIFTSDNWAAINPAWSPDGRRVAFAAVGRGRLRPEPLGPAEDLWIVGADGLNPTRITASPAADWMPCWSIDGRLYFVSDRSGSDRIWSTPAP